MLEEIIGDLNSRLLGAVLLASVLGALVVHGIIGKQPSFTLTGRGIADLDRLSADAAGARRWPVVVGVYFQRPRSGCATDQETARDSRLAGAAGRRADHLGSGRGGLLATGHLGVFSLGYDDLSSALAGDIGWQLAAVLLVAKFIATSAAMDSAAAAAFFRRPCFSAA